MTTLLKFASETNILVVDDHPDNLRLLAKMLESEGYVVRKSLNGKMALQAAHRDPPDLILLDINMPEMNGYEVCQQLRQSDVTSHIPIIFISALDQVTDKVQAFELGGQDYITKPFQESEVLVRVKSQLLIRQQQQKLIEQNQRLEQEIEERLKAEAAVRQLSLIDDLTGLYNRRGFFFLANQQLKMAQRTQTACCLMFIDLDGLKQINDSLGHQIGDIMLTGTAQILKRTFRDADIVSRLGGDEFVIFVPVCPNTMEDFYTRLQKEVEHFNQANHYACELSLSIGVKQYSCKEELSLEQLLEQADSLMYQHKRSKRFVHHYLS